MGSLGHGSRLEVYGPSKTPHKVRVQHCVLNVTHFFQCERWCNIVYVEFW